MVSLAGELVAMRTLALKAFRWQPLAQAFQALTTNQNAWYKIEASLACNLILLWLTLRRSFLITQFLRDILANFNNLVS